MLLATAIFSCKKDVKQKEETPGQNQGTPPNIPTGSFNPVIFSKSLAKAMESSALQSFLKKEALLQFDNDYDILFQKIKDEVVEGKTVYERLLATTSDKDGLKKEVEQNPLLTIFVPALKNFSAEKWNTNEKPPVVGIRNVEDSKSNRPMYGYTNKGSRVTMDYRNEPTFPIVVLKVNERLTMEKLRDGRIDRQANPLLYFNNEAGTFQFLDEAFSKNDNPSLKDRESRVVIGNPNPIWARDGGPLDERIVYAATNNVPCHRDYIYYGIDPVAGVDRGTLKNNYAEFITEIHFNNKEAFDYARDWTEGELEIFFNAFFVKSSGGVESLQKGLTVAASRLEPPPDGRGITTHIFADKPIEIACWDMQKYGDTWKFSLLEYDPGTETTTTTTASSTFGSNYGGNGGLDFGFVKIGVNFGSSATTTQTNTATYKTTNTSDNLGEALLDYGAPIMTRIARTENEPFYWFGNTYDLNTGMVTFTVETRRRW